MINLFNIDIKKIRYNGANIKLIKLGDTIIYEAPTDYGVYKPGIFRDDNQLTEVEVTVNDSVTDLSYMFYNCINLASVNIEDWDTSNVTDMSFMFYDCDSLTKLDLSNFDTRKVTNMDRIVGYCDKLEELDLSNFNTIHCREDSSIGNGISWLMPYCKNLYTLHLDNCNNNTVRFILDHANISRGNQYNPPTKIGTIYCKESSAKGITPPYGWEFEYVSERPSTKLRLYNEVVNEFAYNEEITEVNTIIESSHIDLRDMFLNCSKLVSVNTDDWDTDNVIDMSYMFFNCPKLTELDLSTFDTSKVTDMHDMFAFCDSIVSLDLSNFDMTNVTNSAEMFWNCVYLQELHLDNCNSSTINKIITSSNFPTNAIGDKTRIIYCKKSESKDKGLVAPTNWVFSFVPEEPEIPLYKYNEFTGDTNITTVDVMVDSSHNASNNMFNGCINLVSVDTLDWDTSNIFNMLNMFNNCKSLKTLDLRRFNTSNVDNMNWMFYNCESLETLNIRNFDTSKATANMRDMFYNCTSLTTLRLDNCSNDTISSIITQSSFPANNRGTIYCRRANAEGLKAPGNWIFSYIDID